MNHPIEHVAALSPNPSWTGTTIAAEWAILSKDTGNAATDILVAYMQDSTVVSSTNGTFTVSLPNPTLKITAA